MFELKLLLLQFFCDSLYLKSLARLWNYMYERGSKICFLIIDYDSQSSSTLCFNSVFRVRYIKNMRTSVVGVAQHKHTLIHKSSNVYLLQPLIKKQFMIFLHLSN
jgi:hypothetical protein